ncbi:hypothetical protein SprV_0702368900 [Sparganum proliferum]
MSGGATPPLLYLRESDENLRHVDRGGLWKAADIWLSRAITCAVDASCNGQPGIRVVYRTDRQLLRQRRVHFRLRASTTSVHELLFADECALNVTSKGITKERVPLRAACDNSGLIISAEETVVMHKSPPNATYTAPQISVSNAQLQAVDTFTYLGSTIIDDELSHRLSKASQAR